MYIQVRYTKEKVKKLLVLGKKCMSKSWNYCTCYTKWIAPFSWCKESFLWRKGKKEKSRDNKKPAENSCFYCGPQAEKAIKST